MVETTLKLPSEPERALRIVADALDSGLDCWFSFTHPKLQRGVTVAFGERALAVCRNRFAAFEPVVTYAEFCAVVAGVEKASGDPVEQDRRWREAWDIFEKRR